MPSPTRTATKYVAASLFAATAAFAAGCGSDTTSPFDQFPGTYTLRTVNGQSLPVTLPQTDPYTTTAISADVYTFNSDGTFTEQVAYLIGTNTGTTTQSSVYQGTWNLNGTSVTVNDATDNSTVVGTFSGGNTITLDVPLGSGSAVTAVYQK